VHTVILHILFLVSFLIFTTLHSIAKYFVLLFRSSGKFYRKHVDFIILLRRLL
jgi:hypothetical protein